MSLDGYIAGPNGEYDWIVMDPAIDFAGLMSQFDTFLIGRKTFDAMKRMGNAGRSSKGITNIVLSRTLRQADHPQVRIESDAARLVTELRAQPGKDIAIFGGGELFRSLLAEGLVDRIEMSLIPVLLGGGIPLLPPPAGRAKLKLRGQRVYEKTGTVGLEYDILRDSSVMRPPYRLRAADARDADAIAALHADSWRRTYRGMMSDAFLDGDALENRRQVWRERLGAADADRLVVVADDGARIVGFVCVFARGDAGWGAYIDNLHVVFDWKGRGVGRALMSGAADWICATQPDPGVYLWVMEANAAARAFYDRLGAQNVETITLADPAGGSAPNCRYVWPDARRLL
jgi:dihydrofolate reductase/ribosomal protein S18 acetylase RimI-like enzyme